MQAKENITNIVGKKQELGQQESIETPTSAPKKITKTGNKTATSASTTKKVATATTKKTTKPKTVA